MRILHVNKFHFVKGGAERYVADLADAQQRAGHEVAPFAMQHARNAATPFAKYFPSEVDFDGAGARSLGVAARIVYSREAASCLDRLLRDWRPDVAHLHNIAHQLTPSILPVLAKHRIPVVQTLHDYKIACPSYLFLDHGSVCEACNGGRFYEAARRRCHRDSFAAGVVLATEAYLHRALGSYDTVQRFLCPSRWMRDTMARHGLPAEKLTHLPYCVPAANYAPAEGDGEDVLYAGRLSREKGLATLLAAVRQLPGTRLAVAGEGPERPALEAAREDGVAVTLLGYLNGEALHEAVRRARVVVVPSEWYENLPFAVLEAMALGRAVVGARIGGIPELVEDGVTGYTFAPRDADGLAQALATALADGARAAQQGRTARRRIEADFAPGAHLERLHAIYDAVAGEAVAA